MSVSELGHDGRVSTTSAKPDIPAATRHRPPGWRDPRLWVGVALVAASVLIGARLLAAADDTVTVWGAAQDLAAGDTVEASDLRPVRLRFADEADLVRYLTTSNELPEDLVLARGIDEGELVPAAALGSADEAAQRSISLAFPPESVPTSVEVGSVLDLLLVVEETASSRSDDASEPTVVRDVVVLDTPSLGDSLSSASRGRQLVLSVPDAEDAELAALVNAARDQRVQIIAHG